MLILVVNAGSSSLKYQVRDTSLPEAEQMLTSGLVENIGTDAPTTKSHSTSCPRSLSPSCTAASCRQSATAWCRVQRSSPTPPC